MVDIFASRIACTTYTFWKDKNQAVVVDPGYNIHGCLIEHLEKLGVNVAAVLLTHAHYDHTDGLEELLMKFPNAQTYISADEFPDLDNPRMNLCTWSEWGKHDLTFVPKNIVQLLDGELIHVGGYDIKCLLTPFHTRGSMCFVVEEENALFSGDTLFYTTVGRTDLPSSKPKLMSSSLLKLVNLSKNYIVYPGHGPKTSLEREKKYNSYLRNI